MPTASPKIPPMPGPEVPIVMSNGTVNPVWREWLEAFVKIMRTVRGEIP